VERRLRAPVSGEATSWRREARFAAVPVPQAPHRARTGLDSAGFRHVVKASLPRTAWLEATFVLLFATAWRLPGMFQEWAGDELYQVLAARQYLVDGTLSIAGGEPYVRGQALTLLVARLFSLFGESAFVARLPALLCGSLAVAVLYLWLRSYGERLAAVVAALLLAVDPESVKLSQMMRFYTPQMLLFLVGVIASHALIERRRDAVATVALAGVAAMTFFFAYELQIVTMIGISGVGIYAALVLGQPLLASARAGWPGRLLLLLVVAAGLGAVFYAFQSGFVAEALHLVSYVDLWALESAQNPGFYVGRMLDGYPGLWTAFGLAAVLAATRQFRLTLLCVLIFGIAFFVHSLLAWKAERYLFYSVPFFFVVLGLAVARVAGPFAALVDGLVRQSAALRSRPRLARAARNAIVAGVVLFAALSHPALIRSVRSLFLDPSYRHPGMGKGSISWGRASQVLEPLVKQTDTVVATDDLKAIYYLGRVDYVLDRDHLFEDRRAEQGPRPEFSIDVKINRPMVSEPKSIAHIMACNENGLIVAQDYALETPFFVPPDTRRFILEHGEPVPLPAEWGISVFRWKTPRGSLASDCPPQPLPDGLANGGR
jgi:hypothetical protein